MKEGLDIIVASLCGLLTLGCGSKGDGSAGFGKLGNGLFSGDLVVDALGCLAGWAANGVIESALRCLVGDDPGSMDRSWVNLIYPSCFLG